MINELDWLNSEFKIEGHTFSPFSTLEKSILENILEWRNSDSIRNWMSSTRLISANEHWEFIEKLKTNQYQMGYWAVRFEQVIIGVVSVININNSICEPGYYLIPSQSKSGKGHLMAKLFYGYLLERGFNKLVGKINKKNISAILNAKSMGFKIIDSTILDQVEFLIIELEKKDYKG